MKAFKSFSQTASLITFGLLGMSTLALANDVLVNPITLNIHSLSPDIKLENLEVSYTALCQYKSGIFFPENKLCGNSEVKVAVNADGTIHLPALSKFSGFHASNSDNYRVDIELQPKNRDPRDQTYYFVLSTYNTDAIQALENLRDLIYVGHLQGGNLNITAERKAILGGDLSRLPNAELLINVGVVSPRKDSLQTPILSTPFSVNITGIENRHSANGEMKLDLLNKKSIQIQSDNFAFIGNPADAKVYINVQFLENNDGTGDKAIYQKSIESKIDPNFLIENSSIDLEKVN